MKFVIAVLMVVFSTSGFTQTVPPELNGKTITVVVPYGPGGNSDLVARVLARKIEQQSGINIVVVNKPGALGSIGTNFVVQAPADGTVVGQLETGPSMVNTITGAPNSHDITKLSPVSTSIENYLAVIVNSSLQVNNLNELGVYLRNNKDKASYAIASGIMTLFSEEILEKLGVAGGEPIPYKSGADCIKAVLAGEVAFTLLSPADASALTASGKLKILAIGSPQRIEKWKDVPSISETIPNLVVSNYNGIFVPSTTPKHVKMFLSSLWNKASTDSEVVQFFKEQGVRSVGGSVTDAESFFNRYYKQRVNLYEKYQHKLK